MSLGPIPDGLVPVEWRCLEVGMGDNPAFWIHGERSLEVEESISSMLRLWINLGRFTPGPTVLKPDTPLGPAVLWFNTAFPSLEPAHHRRESWLIQLHHRTLQ